MLSPHLAMTPKAFCVDRYSTRWILSKPLPNRPYIIPFAIHSELAVAERSWLGLHNVWLKCDSRNPPIRDTIIPFYFRELVDVSWDEILFSYNLLPFCLNQFDQFVLCGIIETRRLGAARWINDAWFVWEARDPCQLVRMYYIMDIVLIRVHAES